MLKSECANFDINHQLVSSATSNTQTDAFNFLSAGAGRNVFEIFLNLYIGIIFVVLVCSLGNRPQVQPVSIYLSHSLMCLAGLQMDVHDSYLPVRSL